MLDAYALFNHLALRAKRKDNSVAIYQEHANGMFGAFPEGDFESAKARARVVTVFDLQGLAVSVANVEFKEL
ncbi:MAG: hypothetical protein AB7T49_04185 [Oligoflexales bacterium]